MVNGGISFYDMVGIIKSKKGGYVGYFDVTEEVRSRLLKEISFKEIKTLDAGSLIWATSFVKKLHSEKQGEETK